jgi:amino acid adenylation domain-containing protein
MSAARKHPNRVAFSDGSGGNVRYGEAARMADWLAAMLHQRTNGAGRVAIATTRSARTVIGMLAVLRAGLSYVPIDPAAPAARQEFVVRDAGCVLALTDQPSNAAHLGIPVIDLEMTMRLAASSALPPARVRLAQPEDEAYVLYTSGSTGTPKGVVITHRNASSFVRWAAAAFPLGRGDQVAVHAPLHFDLPVYDIYVGLGAGATLHIVPEHVALFPQGLYRFLAERSISHIYAVPSALTALLNRSTLRRDGLRSLRRILYAGEEFRPGPLRAFMSAVPQATVANLYGPIETNVVTSWKLDGPPREDARVPLGRAAEGVILALLQDDGTAASTGPAEGEIVVAGDCVTPGYLHQPDLTAASRVRLQVDGEIRTFYRTGDFARRDGDDVLHLLGRRDGLIKTRGFRVEVGEIEATIGSHQAVADVAVVAEPDPELTHLLHAVVVPAARSGESIAEDVIAHCRRHLPGYMVPGKVHVVYDLPRTSTGKIARAALSAQITGTSGGRR